MTGLFSRLDALQNTESHHVNESSYIFHMCDGGTPLWLGNLDPYIAWLLPHTTTMDSSRRMARLLTSPMMKSYVAPVWSRLHPSFADEGLDYSVTLPSDLLQGSRWCPAVSGLEMCSRSTSHHLDSSDLLGHGNSDDRRSGAGRRQLFWRRITMVGCYSTRWEWHGPADCQCVMCLQCTQSFRQSVRRTIEYHTNSLPREVTHCSVVISGQNFIGIFGNVNIVCRTDCSLQCHRCTPSIKIVMLDLQTFFLI